MGLRMAYFIFHFFGFEYAHIYHIMFHTLIFRCIRMQKRNQAKPEFRLLLLQSHLAWIQKIWDIFVSFRHASAMFPETDLDDLLT